MYTTPIRQLISSIHQISSSVETHVGQIANYALTLLAKDYWGLARAKGSDFFTSEPDSRKMLQFSS